MDKIKEFCNICSNENWHTCLYSIEKNYSDEKYHDLTEYVLLECCGCERIKMLIIERSDSCGTDENGQTIPFVKQFPPKVTRNRPKWIADLLWPFEADVGLKHRQLATLIDEIYTALQNDSNRLAVMGVRALLESIMIEKCGDNGTFKNNISKFENDGFISSTQRKALELVLEAGHAAIHRSYEPTREEILAALDITENIIESIFIISSTKSKKLSNVPQRKNT